MSTIISKVNKNTGVKTQKKNCSKLPKSKRFIIILFSLLTYSFVSYLILECINQIYLIYMQDKDYKKITDAFRAELLHDGRAQSTNKSMLSFTAKFYFFHLTNPDEVKMGRKPILKERGPYFYSEHHSKVILHIEEGTIKYRPKTNYIFQPEISHGTEDDLITLPNIPFIGLLKMIWDSSKNSSTISKLDQELSSQGENLFRTASVKDWLFNGISISNSLNVPFPEIQSIKAKIPERFSDGKFGFFYKDNAKEDIWVVSTDAKNIGSVLRWNENKNLNIWNDEPCNEISRTDGTVFPPFVNETSEICIFSPELCRSFKLQFKTFVKYDGSPSLGFGFNEEGRSPINSKNPYCDSESSKSQCPNSGILEVDKCWGGLPIFLSAPHFQNGCSELANGVEGLRPYNNEVDYNTYFYFGQDSLGEFQGRTIRLQLNINIQPYPSTRTLSSLKNTMIPLFWIEQAETVDYEPLGLRSNLASYTSPPCVTFILFTFLLLLNLVIASIVALNK